MKTLLVVVLPVVGCALMMAICMGLMAGGRRLFSRDAPPEGTATDDHPPATAAEVAALRAEVERLRAERAQTVPPDGEIPSTAGGATDG